MTALREVFAHFGIQFDRGPLVAGSRTVDAARASLSRFDRIVSGVTGGLRALGVTLGAGILARGAVRFMGDMVALGDDLNTASQRVGLSAQALQSWRHAADLGGVSAES